MFRLYENYADFEDRLQILQLFSEFDYHENKTDFAFQYTTVDEKLTELRKNFDYPFQMVPGKEFRSMVQLMVWVFEHLSGDGMCKPPPIFNTEAILKGTAEHGLKSNCFMHAVVCNEILLSMGFPSRMVRCMPMDLEYSDCHCVTEVYSQQYHKWIVLDAANRAYYLDQKMIPLNLFEIREAFLAKRPLYVPMMSRSRSKALFQYLVKNLVRFETDQISRFGAENWIKDRKIIHFQSKNFPISDKVVAFPEQNCSICHLHTSNPNLFWANPYERSL